MHIFVQYSIEYSIVYCWPTPGIAHPWFPWFIKRSQDDSWHIFYHLLQPKLMMYTNFHSRQWGSSLQGLRTQEARTTFLIPGRVTMIPDIFFHLLDQKWDRIPKFSSLHVMKRRNVVSVFCMSSKEAKRMFLIPGGVRMIPDKVYHLLEQK